MKNETGASNASLRIAVGILWLLGVCLFPHGPANGQAQERTGVLPAGPALAAQYPGDGGIAKAPAVLFAENFEEGSLDALARRWDDVSNKGGKVLAFSSEVPSSSRGKRSLQMTATMGENTGGHLYTRLARSVDTAFVRLYVKFGAEHFAFPCSVHFGGHNPPTAWPQGNPGRPHGDERMMVEFGPVSESGKHAPPGVWGISGFWSEMKASADGHYWGNLLRPARPAPVARGRWQCVEVMLKCNSAPGRSDQPAATTACHARS